MTHLRHCQDFKCYFGHRNEKFLPTRPL